jgi:hypothetical protein
VGALLVVAVASSGSVSVMSKTVEPSPQGLAQAVPGEACAHMAAGGPGLSSYGVREMLFLTPYGRLATCHCNRLRVTLRRRRVSRDYFGLSVSSLTWDVRTSKGISKIHVIVPLNLKKALHRANLQNSPVWPEAQVLA